MARSKSKKAKAEQAADVTWSDVAEASAEARADDDAGADGVVHEGGGPVYLEPMSAEARAAAGEQLAQMVLDLAKAEQDAKDAAADARKDIKARRKKIAELRDQVLSGMRKVEAQAGLPGVQ